MKEDNESAPADGVSSPESSSEDATTPPAPEETGEKDEREDKFLQATHRVTRTAEKAIGTSYRKIRDTVKATTFRPAMGVESLQSLLEWCRNTFPAETFSSLGRFMVRAGHIALLVSLLLSLVFGVAAALKLSNWVYLLFGFGVALVLWVLQFTADRFLNAGDGLLADSPTKLRSTAFLDCACLLAEAAGILVFILSAMLAQGTQQWGLLLIGLAGWGLADAVAYVSMHPVLLNIDTSEDVSAAEEAIGILSFFAKAAVRIVPIAYGVGAVLGAVGLLVGIMSVISDGLVPTAMASIQLIGFCSLLPLLSYVLFAFYRLAVDLMKAVLGCRPSADGAA
ncbi:MAG: hypothetical protein HQ559_15155 [Lentisphaerae bacterium]|nr:hypothetical protein [Lentisphaerota bacterium]